MATANYPATPIKADKNKDRVYKRTLGFIAVNDGVTISATYGFNKVACTLEDFPDVVMEKIDERETVLAGKQSVKSNSGFRVPALSVVFQGNDSAVAAAILSQPLTTAPVVRIGQTVSDFGFAQIISYNENLTIAAEMLLCRASADLMQAPGVSPGGNKFNISMYSDFGQVYVTKAGEHINLETWFNSGAIVNAAAPDGALDTFVLGTSNNATSSYTASSALVMDNTAGIGSHAKYIPVLMVKNGTTGVWSTLRDTTDFTFTLATGTITMTAGSAYENLPAGSKIVAAWASTQANGTTLGSIQSWQEFQGV